MTGVETYFMYGVTFFGFTGILWLLLSSSSFASLEEKNTSEKSDSTTVVQEFGHTLPGFAIMMMGVFATPSLILMQVESLKDNKTAQALAVLIGLALPFPVIKYLL